ncbi:TAXI family TRAP transporter solute-binding subunit [Allostreptomyces psammosilenae]|uniref:TAXI family TRAP transporter solute-binding subunit n=1 Tax=Allostreptomyces psammosilenae TaxID=1892865 RepID=UPI0035E430F8
MLRWGGAAGLAGATAVGAWQLSALAAGGGPSGRLRFTTGVPTGVYHMYAEQLLKAFRHDLPDVRVELAPSQGSVENLRRLATGEADLGFVAADAVADYCGEGQDRLRAVARLYDDYIQLVVPRNSPVRTIWDLRGLRVGIGQPKSGVELVTRRLLKAAELVPDVDFEAVAVSIDRAPALLRGDGADAAERLDAFFWSGGLPTRAVSELVEPSVEGVRPFPVRLVPLDGLAETLHQLPAPADACHAQPLRAYRVSTVPAGTYRVRGSREVPAAVPTIAVPNLLVCNEGLERRLAEAATRVVMDSRDRIGEEVHSAQLVDLRTAIYTHPLALHTGAQDYYRSVKP